MNEMPQEGVRPEQEQEQADPTAKAGVIKELGGAIKMLLTFLSSRTDDEEAKALVAAITEYFTKKVGSQPAPEQEQEQEGPQLSLKQGRGVMM